MGLFDTLHSYFIHTGQFSSGFFGGTHQRNLAPSLMLHSGLNPRDPVLFARAILDRRTTVLVAVTSQTWLPR